MPNRVLSDTEPHSIRKEKDIEMRNNDVRRRYVKNRQDVYNAAQSDTETPPVRFSDARRRGLVVTISDPRRPGRVGVMLTADTRRLPAALASAFCRCAASDVLRGDNCMNPTQTHY